MRYTKYKLTYTLSPIHTADATRSTVSSRRRRRCVLGFSLLYFTIGLFAVCDFVDDSAVAGVPVLVDSVWLGAAWSLPARGVYETAQLHSARHASISARCRVPGVKSPAAAAHTGTAGNR